MEMTERQVGDVTVLELAGRLTLGTPTDNLRDKMNSLVHQGHRRIVLNVDKVESVDSGGLGELVRSHSTVKMKEGKVCLANLPKRIHDLLVLTRLSTVFDVFDSEDAAVKSLAS